MAAEVIGNAQVLPQRRVRRPIIVLGASRSGTSLLSRMFRNHPDVAFMGEPRPVWMYGNAYRPDHELRASHLSPRIARYIDEQFGRFLEESGRSRFAEKTPSNCLRVEFIHALYPDCQMVNIIRDGRTVVRSQLHSQKEDAPQGYVWERMRQTNLLEWPAYLPMFLRTVWRLRVLKRPPTFWGPKPEGWKRWLDLPPHVIAAKQWKALVEASIRDGRRLPAENYREVRYERFVREPVTVVGELFDFCGLSHDPGVLAYARDHVSSTRQDRWEGTIPAEHIREAEAEMKPLLEELGYV